jgi:hypothetical protein
LKEVSVGKLLLIATTGFSQEYCLRAIFRSLIDDRRVKTNKFFWLDSVAAAAGSFMRENVDLHVAVVLDTDSEDPQKIRELYESACRQIKLEIAWAPERWHVAVAVPNLMAWALIDDHVRQEYEKFRQDSATASTPEERIKIEQANYRALGEKIGEWTAEHPFDLEKLKQKSRQVRELCAFIDKALHYEPKPEPVLATAADWF